MIPKDLYWKVFKSLQTFGRVLIRLKSYPEAEKYKRILQLYFLLESLNRDEFRKRSNFDFSAKGYLDIELVSKYLQLAGKFPFKSLAIKN